MLLALRLCHTMHASPHISSAKLTAQSSVAVMRLVPRSLISLEQCRLQQQLPNRHMPSFATLPHSGGVSYICKAIRKQPRYHGALTWSAQQWHSKGRSVAAAVPACTVQLQGGDKNDPRRHRARSLHNECFLPAAPCDMTAASSTEVLSYSIHRHASMSVNPQRSCVQLHGLRTNPQQQWGYSRLHTGLPSTARRSPGATGRSVIAAAARRSNASSTSPDDWLMTQELQEVWLPRLEGLQRHSSIQAREQLDLQWQLGIAPGFKDHNGKAISNAGLFSSAKEVDPEAVALIQMGKEYQAVGLDAVLLMEHANLPQLPGAIPVVKCSADNLHQTVMELVQEGVSVAVWDSAAADQKHVIGTKSLRYRTHLVTPDSPFMVDGYSDTSEDRDFDLPHIIGVSLTSNRGCTVYVLDQRTRMVSVYEGLSDDGIWGVITADTAKRAVVHLHKPTDLPKQLRTGLDASDFERRYVMMKKRLQGRIKAVMGYEGKDGLEGFKHELRKFTGIAQDEAIMHKPAYDAAGHWPGVRPLYLSTILQLGLIPSPCVPPLADYLLPKDSSDRSGKLVREMLVSLLLNPPPHEVATALRRVLRFFRDDLTTGVSFMVGAGMDPKTLTVVLQKGEANECKFWSLQKALTQIQRTALDPASNPDKPNNWDQTVPRLQQMTQDIWPALCHIMSCEPQQLTKQQVLKATQQALLDISRVVASEDGWDDDSSSSSNAGQPDKQRISGSSEEIDAQLASFAEGMERYAQRVKSQVIAQEVIQVKVAFEDMRNTVKALLSAAQEAAKLSPDKSNTKDLVQLYVDLDNSAVWLKMPAKVAAQIRSLRVRSTDGQQQQQVLRKASDHNGVELKQRVTVYSCELLDEKLTAYRDAVAAANSAAGQALRDLSAKLAVSQIELTAAVQLGILLQMLTDHAKAAKDAQWSLPAVGQQEQLQAGVNAETVGDYGAFSLKDLHPYWMSCLQGSGTVRNDVTLDGMMMLTGPNMAGKSTVLRALAAAALCANVGLYIPAGPGSLVPHLDAIMLRTFSGDAPVEGLSGYAVEMQEMRYVLSDATSRSLVLIDELGKGTEVELGTAIASALLQQLMHRQSYGIFATHLHGLLELLKDVDGISRYCMEVVQQQGSDDDSRSSSSSSSSGSLVPTRRVVPGVCTRSLAFDVARQQGVPEHVLQRAQEDYDRLLSHTEYQAGTAVVAAAASGTRSQHTDAHLEAAAYAECNSSGGAATNSSSSSSSRTAANLAASSNRPLNPEFQDKVKQQAHQVQIMLARIRVGDPPALDRLGSQPEDPLPHEQSNGSQLGSDSGSQGVQVDVSGVRHLRPGYGPPPMDHKEPVVYAVRYSTNIWHVGESEDVGLRWRQHQRKKHKQEQLLQHPEMWYVVLETRDAAVRKQRQAYLAAAMDAAGFAQDSLHDVHHKRRK